MQTTHRCTPLALDELTSATLQGIAGERTDSARAYTIHHDNGQTEALLFREWPHGGYWTLAFAMPDSTWCMDVSATEGRPTASEIDATILDWLHTKDHEDDEHPGCYTCGRNEHGYGEGGNYCHRHADKG